MEFFEAIANRHSYRGKYQEKSVPREDLKKIVEAGMAAPSGCNAQTTSFVILDDAEVINKIEEIIGKSAPAMIVCVVDPKPVYKEMSFEIEDCAAAVENMLLAITAMGYASVWLDGVLRNGIGEQIGKILGVSDGQRVQILLPIGIPAEKVTAREKKPISERAWFNKFQG